MKGLIIKPYWGSQILNAKKTWEIRGSATNIRGTVQIIFSGKSKIFGCADLVDCIPLTRELFEENRDKHRIDPLLGMMAYKNPHAWVLSNPVLYDDPIPYKHPQGAVIWVNLEGEPA